MAGTSSYRIELAAREHLPALPEIEVRASERFPSEDIATEMRAHGLPLSCFEKAQEAGRLWIINDPDSVSGNYRRRGVKKADGMYARYAPLLFEMKLAELFPSAAGRKP